MMVTLGWMLNSIMSLQVANVRLRTVGLSVVRKVSVQFVMPVILQDL